MILSIVAALVAFVLALLFGVPYIDFLKKKMLGQYIREEAPETHAQKGGTPTTGGVFLVTAAVIAAVVSLFMAEKTSTGAFLLLITFIFYMFAGFQDDAQKFAHHENKGLSARGKLLLQIAIACLPVMFVTIGGRTFLTFGEYAINLGWLYPVFGIFLITGVSNAVNLTDGLDGLAGSLSAVAFIAFALISFVVGFEDIGIFCLVLVGSLIGFLIFNTHPAKVFMGDTGSLALGGVMGAVAILTHRELTLLVVAGVFVIETLSVILQVFWLRFFHKKLFLMTPLHHHFEKLGWQETDIVKLFVVFGLFLAMGGIIFGVWL